MSEKATTQRAYTRELGALAIGGLVAGFTASILQLIAGGATAPLMMMSFGAILGLMANLGERREGVQAMRLVLGVLSGIAMALLLPLLSLIHISEPTRPY